MDTVARPVAPAESRPRRNVVQRSCRPLLLFFCTFGMVLLLSVPARGQNSTLTGVVTDAETGSTLPGVNIVVENADVRRGAGTDARGRYRIESIASGAYVVRATAVGYETGEQTVRLDAGETVTLNLRLRRQPYGLGEVVVNTSRRTSFATSPTSVSVIGPDALERQSAFTGDIGAILSQQVPGMATSTGALSNYGQTLRGRGIAVLIDGIPQSTPLREASRDLRTINPSALERIEVVRGASAIYGYGGAGGVINYVTKRPSADGMRLHLETGSRFQVADIGESLGGHFAASGTARVGQADMLISAAYERWGQFYDARNDLIPQDPQSQGGLAGADETNVLAKLGYQIDPQQRITALFNFYNFKQDLIYGGIPGVVDSVKATATDDLEPKGEDVGTDNIIAGLNYRHDDLLGSALSARIYYQDYKTRFGYLAFFPGGGQSFVTSEKVGLRLDMDTPLSFLPGSSLLWGIDALRDETAQPLLDGRIFAPPIEQVSAAPFAQVKFPLGEYFLATGGVRYQNFWLEVADFVTLRPTLDTDGDGAPDTRNDVEGGSLSYDALVFNAGLRAYVTDWLEAFASFGQGFSTNDIGRVLRATRARSVKQLHPEAQTVNSYELGLHAGSAPVSATLVGFLNTSELGSTFSDLPALSIVRSPERIRGVEVTLDARPAPRLRTGGALTWLEGKRDGDDDGTYETYLPGYRVPPMKITGYVGYSPVEGWVNRLQLLYSGARERFPDGGFGQGDVEPFTRIDYMTSFGLGALAPGRLHLGVHNLLDAFYFPTVSQWWNLGSGYAAAPGRRISLTYAVTL